MLMLVASIAWTWWTEPFVWQKEDSARDFMSDVGGRYVKPEHQHLMDKATCHMEGPVNMGARGPMMPESVLLCMVPGSCGKLIERVVYHNRYVGAFTTAEPLSWTVAETCPDMLRPEVLQEIEMKMDQGG
jgi:hypothetical protein